MEGGQLFIGILGIAIGAGIGALIGQNRKIGAGWAAVLGGILGFIGWIIALCSERANKTHYDDMSKGGSR